MEDILILVHVEPMFERLFPSLYIPRLVKAALNHPYVVHFTSYVDDYGPIEQLCPLINEEVDWTWVHPRLRELAESKPTILLGGGCIGECLLNMETCLNYLGIKYRSPRGMRYG